MAPASPQNHLCNSLNPILKKGLRQEAIRIPHSFLVRMPLWIEPVGNGLSCWGLFVLALFPLNLAVLYRDPFQMLQTYHVPY